MSKHSLALTVQAKNLHRALRAQGIKKPLAFSQELIAAQYGAANWDTLCGMAKAEDALGQKPLLLVDLPGAPDEVHVIRPGQSAKSFKAVAWDSEIIELVHTPDFLREWLEANSDAYPEGFYTEVIGLQGDGEDLSITVFDLQDGKHVRDSSNKDFWYLPMKNWYLSFWFMANDQWRRPEAPPKIFVPEVVKSADGVQLLALRSHDGSEWDHYVLIPAHIRVEDIRGRITEELDRLQELDRANENNPEYLEYSIGDIERFVRTLGCAFVHTPEELGRNWDVA